LANDSLGAHVLEGKYFNELPLNLQERVQDTQLTMYILDAKAPERARLDIFERVNSGEPLTRQQMRNALYNGPATQWLKNAAESSNFRSATGQSLNAKTMRDREAINRFCAFKLIGWQRYTTGDMDRFLAEGLRELAKLSLSDMMQLFASFDDTMAINRELFKEHAFRKSMIASNVGAARSVINISLFEVCAVTMSAYDSLSLESHADAIRKAVIDLVKDENFARVITYSTNSTAAVRNRFAAMEQALAQVMTA
jgi:hypothetical protein